MKTAKTSIATTTIKAESFTYNKSFVFTALETETAYELWVTSNGYGISELCFGIDKFCSPSSIRSIRDFIDIVVADVNLKTYADSFKKEYMDY